MPCERCDKKVRTIVKMGGLLCARCRVILKDTVSPEYKEALAELRKKIGAADEKK